MAEKTRGGSRPGAGRKALAPEKKKVQATVTLTPAQLEDMKALLSRGVDVNKVIGREIHRLATAYDLADLGIV